MEERPNLIVKARERNLSGVTTLRWGQRDTVLFQVHILVCLKSMV